MKTPLVSEFWSMGARYRPLIAGALLLPLLAASGVASSFDRARIERVWQAEFGVPAPNAALPSAFPSASAGFAPADGLANHPAAAHRRNDQPHPAVARIVVPEHGAVAYGSGSLVDVRQQYGLVITNWHVVRDAEAEIEVIFPGGFTSKARALKVDPDWDLAALAIWRPPIEPLKIASRAPQPGDELTICGYGPGVYRSITGRCTQYYAPKPQFPHHMVELDVQARQGDSGGPIFNSQGELAGVLFGAGQGTTMGSFGGQVDTFLASLAPDIGRAQAAQLASDAAAPQDIDVYTAQEQASTPPSTPEGPTAGHVTVAEASPEGSQEWASTEAEPTRPQTQGSLASDDAVTAAMASDEESTPGATDSTREQHAVSFASLEANANDQSKPDQSLEGQLQQDPFQSSQSQPGQSPASHDRPRSSSFENVKNVLAAIGVVSLMMLVLKAAG